MNYTTLDISGSEHDGAYFVRKRVRRARDEAPTDRAGYFKVERAFVDGSLPPAVPWGSESDYLYEHEWDFMVLAYKGETSRRGGLSRPGVRASRERGVFGEPGRRVDFNQKTERLYSDLFAAGHVRLNGKDGRGGVKYDVMMCPVATRKGLRTSQTVWSPETAESLGRAYFRVPNSLVDGDWFMRARDHRIRRLMMCAFAFLDEHARVVSPLHLVIDRDAKKFYVSDLFLEAYAHSEDSLASDIGYLCDRSFLYVRPVDVDLITPYIGHSHWLVTAATVNDSTLLAFAPYEVPSMSSKDE